MIVIVRDALHPESDHWEDDAVDRHRRKVQRVGTERSVVEQHHAEPVAIDLRKITVALVSAQYMEDPRPHQGRVLEKTAELTVLAGTVSEGRPQRRGPRGRRKGFYERLPRPRGSPLEVLVPSPGHLAWYEVCHDSLVDHVGTSHRRESPSRSATTRVAPAFTRSEVGRT